MRVQSLRAQFGLFFLAVTIPLTALLVFQNLYAISVVHNQVAGAESTVLGQLVNQMDQSLDAIDKYLIGVVYDDSSLPILDLAARGNSYELAKIQLFNRFSNAALTYPSLGGFFAVFSRSSDLILATNTIQPPVSLQERDDIERYVRNPETDQKGWFLRRVGGVDRAFRFLHSGSVVVGAWINVDALLAPIADQNRTGPSLFVTDDGRLFPAVPEVTDNQIDLVPGEAPFRLSGNPVPFLVLDHHALSGDFRLVTLLPDELILQSLPTLRWVNSGVAATLAVLLLVLFFFLRRIVLRPLGILTRAMARLQSGDLETRIITAPSSAELDLVNQTFNTMAAQIRDLKIHVYEEQLAAHKAELQFLRLQINPHFFLNSLNILYQLAQVQNYVLIQDLSMSLSKYFQFMFRSTSDFVWLQDEWEHIQTYVRIQELRFPKRLRCRFDAPQPLPTLQVPPLIIQGFVENAIKYAFREDDGLDLAVTIEIDAEASEVRILVSDTGPGFPPEFLEAVPSGRWGDSSEHTGIANTRRRLDLLYGEQARLSFRNREAPSGAEVLVVLPQSFMASPSGSSATNQRPSRQSG